MSDTVLVDRRESGVWVLTLNDPVAAAIDLAEQIAHLPAELARDIKQAVGIAAKQGFEATLQFEAWAQASSATKPEIQKTVARFRAATSTER